MTSYSSPSPSKANTNNDDIDDDIDDDSFDDENISEEGGVSSDDVAPVHKRSFSLIQSRKFLTTSMTSVASTSRAGTSGDVCSGHAALGGEDGSKIRVAELCPSMDLILVESQAASLVVYRTLSWQKVAAIQVVSDGTDDEEAGGERLAGADTAREPTLCYCWSPNGQSVAVAQSRQVSLYGVESLANPSAGASGAMASSFGGAGGGADGSTGGPTDSQHSFVTRSRHPVLALQWVHVGRNHPTASAASVEEEERETSWRYQSYYVDQSTKFLPPSAYYNKVGNGGGHVEDLGASNGVPATLLDDSYSESPVTLSSAVPECKTPLSVLCVSTHQSFELYLHGRYPLLTLPRSSPSAGKSGLGTEVYWQAESKQHPPLVVASNDLAYWLMTSTASTSDGTCTNTTLSLYHMPFLKRDRYAWQQIASLHTSLMSHLKTLKQSVSAVANNWKNSLKPLDLKLQPLIRLLKNYGVDVVLDSSVTSTGVPWHQQTLQAVIKDYIMMGHTSHSTSIANAMDQFFTNVQMNDQLLQRMERSLFASMANVESAAIEGIVRPTQALGWQIQELTGLVQSFDLSHSPQESSGRLAEDAIPSKSKTQLLHDVLAASEELWISAEHLLTCIVTSRFLVRDLCGWLRHAGSQVKARGTAANSVQRENAKKRRIPQDVLERLVSALSSGPGDTTGTLYQPQQTGLTESLLNLKVTEMLKHSSDATENKDNILEPSTARPPSPSSVASTLLHPIPKVHPSLDRTIASTTSLFSNPLSNVPSRISPQEIFLPRLSGRSVVATHSRIGRDFNDESSIWDGDDEDDEITCFVPKISQEINHANLPIYGLDKCRQWFLIAHAFGNVVQLFCLPLGDKQTVDDCDEEDDDQNVDIKFYLTSKLVFPHEGSVRDIGFYGDDGKSSLSSGQDSGTGMEGRQKLGVIYQSSSSAVEVWMTSYDSCLWQAMPFDPMLLNPSHVDTHCTRDVVRVDAAAGKDFVLYAETRKISEKADADNSRLILCGSRGMGAVAIASVEGMVSLEVLDLEDDEPDDVDGTDEEDDE